MLGHKAKLFKEHPAIRLDALIPEDNFYRQVEAKLDLSFVRGLVQDHYSPMGRPSIDPIVFFKLQLILFFEGFRSERQLMEQVNLNLAHRWYIGYDLDETIPDHSSLSKIRDRYGLSVFQRFFERIVELCIAAGLVWGKELYLDGTRVYANAKIDSMVPRFYWESQQHVETLFKDEAGEVTTQHSQTETTLETGRGFVSKYDGTRFTARAKHWYRRKTDFKVSMTDPDASPMSRFTGDLARLGYHTHYVVDGGKARVILAALVTPASIMDNTPMLDLVRWVRFRWQLLPDIAVADAKYGTVANITGLEQDGLRAYIPIPEAGHKHGFYSTAEHFRYDPQRDLFICPEGQEMPLFSRRQTEFVYVYRAAAAVCNRCPVKAACTDSMSGRHVRRSFFQEYLDRVHHYHQTEAYKRAMRKRQVWVEPMFGEAKQWHQMRHFRLRRLEKVNIEGLMIAAGQNIKRLLKHQPQHYQPHPTAGGMALLARTPVSSSNIPVAWPAWV